MVTVGLSSRGTSSLDNVLTAYVPSLGDGWERIRIESRAKHTAIA